MTKHRILLLLIVFQLQAFNWVDFDTSMQKEQYADLCSGRYEELYDFFKTCYQNCQTNQVSDSVRIPKITHHICLGHDQWPAEYQEYLNSWFDILPDWQHIMWFDQEVETLLHQFPEWESHYYAQTNWGARADIARYVILWMYGGLYVDWDQQCLQCFDDLHYLFDFYIGIQPLDTNRVQLGIGVIGSCAGHPLLKQVLDEINEQIGPIILRTGPLHFMCIFCKYAQNYSQCSIALPASYFYPCGYEQRGQPASVWLRPESLAVHHWAGSWLHNATIPKKE